MPRFSYKALRGDGQIQKGALSAASRDAAGMRLRAGGLVPIEITQRRSGMRLAEARGRRLRRRPSLRDLTVFTRELGILLGADVPLHRALQMICDEGEGPMPALSALLLSDISRGIALSDAMEAHPKVFPPFFLGMVRAGEAEGNLAAAFQRLYETLERQAQLNAKVRSALIYPIIILLLTGFSVMILLAFVIPQFKPIFNQAGENLPLATKIIVAASDFALAYGALALAGLLLLGLLIWRIRLPQGLRLWRDARLLRLPVLGGMISALEAARFCRVLGTLRSSGVDLLAAVQIAGNTIKNSAVRAGTEHLIEPLTQGEGLSQPLNAVKIFPPLASELIAVGEESGKLDEMLIEAANILDQESDRRIQSALTLLVPLVTVFLGVIVAGVIGSILSAILGTYRIGL